MEPGLQSKTGHDARGAEGERESAQDRTFPCDAFPTVLSQRPPFLHGGILLLLADLLLNSWQNGKLFIPLFRYFNFSNSGEPLGLVIIDNMEFFLYKKAFFVSSRVKTKIHNSGSMGSYGEFRPSG